MLGRESPSASTLTGRVPLWEECFEYVKQQPIQGYGYRSFWIPQHVQNISLDRGWAIAGSHSAYIEITLMLGIIGLISFVIILFSAMARSFQQCFRRRDSNYAFFTLLLMFCILHGILESALVIPRFLMFICTVAFVHFGFFYYKIAENKEQENSCMIKIM
jgi:O-antigen ligase